MNKKLEMRRRYKVGEPKTRLKLAQVIQTYPELAQICSSEITPEENLLFGPNSLKRVCSNEVGFYFF